MSRLGEPVFERGTCASPCPPRGVADGKSVHLTPNEFKLMAALIKNAGKVMMHRQLLRKVWSLRVYMNQLRQKVESDPARPQHLMTGTGVGYRLAAE